MRMCANILSIARACMVIVRDPRLRSSLPWFYGKKPYGKKPRGEGDV
jgi:hypothetical protein